MVHSIAPTTGLAGGFLSIADRLHAGGDPDEAVADVAALAVAVIPFCDWAGITHITIRGQFSTTAATDPVAESADRAQYDLGQGPSVDATRGGGLHWADDLTAANDWPQFSARTVATTPVRSVMSLAIGPDPNRVALNLYSGSIGGFTVDTVDRTGIFAAHAELLLMYMDKSTKVDHLNRALASSRLIGTAIGILMYAHRITADEAFTRMKRASQDGNRKLTDIAAEVVQNGVLPPGRVPGARMFSPP